MNSRIKGKKQHHPFKSRIPQPASIAKAAAALTLTTALLALLLAGCGQRRYRPADWNSPENNQTTLPGTTLPGTTLPGTTLPGTTLPGTTLPGTTLPGQSLPGTTLPGRDCVSHPLLGRYTIQPMSSRIGVRVPEPARD